MPLKNNMNDRERKRYERTLRDSAQNALDAANALRDGKDEDFFIAFLALSMQSAGFREISQFLMESNFGNAGKPDFPDTIFS